MTIFYGQVDVRQAFSMSNSDDTLKFSDIRKETDPLLRLEKL